MRDDFERILLGINIDAAGYRDGATAYSLYGCPDEWSTVIRTTLDAQPGTVEGEPWYQSDHGCLSSEGRPALAITSEQVHGTDHHVTHTEKDTPELVDVGRW